MEKEIKKKSEAAADIRVSFFSPSLARPDREKTKHNKVQQKP